MTAKERLIVALDVPDFAQALAWVEKLKEEVGYFKVGLELLTAVGAPQIVEAIHQRGGKIFFDGKFDDIPHTVAGATKALASLGVAFFDVHASAGIPAMTEVVRYKGNALCLAVTVLTSFDEAGCLRVFGKPSAEKVRELALDAATAGVDGIVCSPQELCVLAREPRLQKLLKVTPGVRPVWAAADDQKRFLTPKQAIEQGATHLVVGRPILQAPASIGSAVAAARKIVEEIAEACP